MTSDAAPAPALPEAPLLDALLEQLPRLSWSREELHAHQVATLTETLHRAVERSPFHRDRLSAVDLDAVTPDDLRALPTMTKRDLMEHWDDVVTDERLTLAGARAHLDTLDVDGFSAFAGEYLVLTSGGTSGEAAVFCWSLDEMAQFGASAIRWSAAAGAGPPERAAWIAARSPRHPSGVAPLMTGATSIPVDQPVAAIVEQLNELQPDALSTVCSMLPVLVEEARRGHLRIAVDAINVFGDVLDRDAAEAASEIFGVRPTQGYPTTDAGCIAQQAPGERGLYLNEDLLLVETVDADDQPVPPGVPTDHLLVTSLFQRTTPLIRYRIDDRVVVDPAPGRHSAYRRLASVDGRSDEVFRYGDAVVHPHVFRTAIGRHLQVQDFDVRQTERGAVVRVVADSVVETAALRDAIVEGLARAGVVEPQVEVEEVEELGRTAVGKRRRFVPMRA
jgi:phenylacetate-coenzyme A ligase PaaK-like adenylate-forming protein